MHRLRGVDCSTFRYPPTVILCEGEGTHGRCDPCCLVRVQITLSHTGKNGRRALTKVYSKCILVTLAVMLIPNFIAPAPVAIPARSFSRRGTRSGTTWPTGSSTSTRLSTWYDIGPGVCRSVYVGKYINICLMIIVNSVDGPVT